MTGAKKRFIAIWSVIGAIVICILIALPLAYVFKPTIPTDEFLPEPDEIVCCYGDLEFSLTEVQQEEIYYDFQQLLATIKDCEHTATDEPMIAPNIRIEFRYNKSHQYIGTLSTDEALSKAPFVFEAVSIGLGERDLGGVWVNVYRDGQCYGIDDTKTWLAFGSYEQSANFCKKILTLSIEGLLRITREPTRTEALETEIFPDLPDAVVLYREGRAMELTGEEMREVYTRFRQITAQVGDFTYRHQVYPQEMVERIAAHTCIEFRYSQRRSFTGEVGEQYELSPSYTAYEYDAVLFVMASADEIYPMGYLEGEYRLESFADHYWAVDRQMFLNFSEYVAALFA